VRFWFKVIPTIGLPVSVITTLLSVPVGSMKPEIPVPEYGIVTVLARHDVGTV